MISRSRRYSYIEVLLYLQAHSPTASCMLRPSGGIFKSMIHGCNQGICAQTPHLFEAFVQLSGKKIVHLRSLPHPEVLRVNSLDSGSKRADSDVNIPIALAKSDKGISS